MTTAQDLDYDDGLDTDEPEPQKPDTNSVGYWQRQARKHERELAAEKTARESLERRVALNDVVPGLNAEGPLGSFLRVYTGEPTAEAIREAVSKDPDFASLITFPADPRDTVAAEQAANATKAAGGSASPGQLTAADVKKWPLDKKSRFRSEQAEAWNTLMSGTVDAIPAPAGWA